MKKDFFLLSSVKVPVNFSPVVVGKICSAYGILGWLKIVSFADRFVHIMNYQPWFINLFLKWRCVHLEYWKNHNSSCRFIVKFKEIFDRDVAQLLNNHEIFVDILQFPNLDDGEYYWKDIIGFRVIGVFGYQFGVVVDLIETGSNDVLVVKNPDEIGDIVNENCLIPFIINRVIKDVSCLDRVIIVDWDLRY